MKTALKRNKPAIWFIVVIILITLACNLPVASQAPSQEATSQPMSPTQFSTSDDNNHRAACLVDIIPGKTNRDQVITLLGEPAATQQEGGYEALMYTSPLRGQYNTVYLLNQVVDWVSIVFTEDNPLTWSAVKAQYGEPAHSAYSDYLEGSRNFAFPEQGLNFIADPDLDIVFIQECFVPMSLKDYATAYGDFLPQEDPFTK